MTPTVSCVVPHYRQPELLAACLDSLAGQIGAPPFEVLVVDDGSETLPFPGPEGLSVTTLSASHRGPAAARNLGARHARAGILAFTDADCRPGLGWLAAVAEAFERQSDLAGVVGPLVDATARARGLGLGSLLHGFMQAISVLDLEPIEIACGGATFVGTIGANLAVSRLWFDRLGGFDESFAHPGGEDYDLGFRLQQAGGRVVFCPRSHVAHHYPADRRALVRRWIHYGMGKAQFAAKHGLTPASIHVVCRRRLHLLTRAPAILRAALRHFPSSSTPGMPNRMVRFFVEWLFQVGAVRAHLAAGARPGHAT